MVGRSELTGKDSQQDAHKVTFVKLLGVEGARALIEELLEFAVEALAPLGKKAEPLRSLAGYVRTRDGEPLAFAILVNNFEGTGAQAQAAIDAIAVRLAEFRR